MRIVLSLAALAVTLALPLTGSPAHAQNARSWVASYGVDGNPCTRSQPCATFNGALAQTNAGGEINCLDSGDFVDMEITHAVTIDCTGVEAGVEGGVFVTANATDVVTLRGLDINGNGVFAQGITFEGGAALHIEKCVIRNFNSTRTDIPVAGILDEAAGNSELFVSDTVVTNNGTGAPGAGIWINPFTDNSVAKVTLNRVEARDNYFGIKADGNRTAHGVINMTIRDSVSTGNISNGVVGTSFYVAIVMMIDRSTSSHNAAGFGVIADGPKTTIRLGGSSIAGNINGVGVSNGGVLQSYGTNQINGNSNDGIASLTPIGLH
ncbi:MAG: hypothetical protein JO273_03640 [Methylobacteriaceae bacterium]|nr:hypothetical protein [Methylobacteriaceae bacterium]